MYGDRVAHVYTSQFVNTAHIVRGILRSPDSDLFVNYTEYSNSDIPPNLINPQTSISMIEPRLLHGANCLSLEATYLLRVAAISIQHTPRMAHPASNRDGQVSV